MLELQIISPRPEQSFPTIKWNYEELKKEIAEAVSDYQNLVVTPETEKDCKETRAKLNKLKTAIENARKDMKKKVNEPLRIFEDQVREVEEPIDKAVENLSKQLQELVDARKEQKRKDIITIWDGIAKKPTYLTIEKIWNEKWLNATYQMKQVTEDLNKILAEDRKNIETLNALPEFSFEAVRYYTQSLNLKEAIARASEHAEMERSKKEAQAAEPKTAPTEPQNEVKPEEKPEQDGEKVYTFQFEVKVTAGQAKTLGDFCRTHGIQLTRIK